MAYTEADGAHADHGDDIEQRSLQPLPEAGTAGHGVGLGGLAPLADAAVVVAGGVAGGRGRLATFVKETHGDVVGCGYFAELLSGALLLLDAGRWTKTRKRGMPRRDG